MLYLCLTWQQPHRLWQLLLSQDYIKLCVGYNNCLPQGFRAFAAVLFTALPELRRAHACVGFEVLAEGELLGKAKLIGHLLDLCIRLAK
jgi:hypothetical protein